MVQYQKEYDNTALEELKDKMKMMCKQYDLVCDCYTTKKHLKLCIINKPIFHNSFAPALNATLTIEQGTLIAKCEISLPEEVLAFTIGIAVFFILISGIGIWQLGLFQVLKFLVFVVLILSAVILSGKLSYKKEKIQLQKRFEKVFRVL